MPINARNQKKFAMARALPRLEALSQSEVPNRTFDVGRGFDIAVFES
jgi:hypothetical protein